MKLRQNTGTKSLQWLGLHIHAEFKNALYISEGNTLEANTRVGEVKHKRAMHRRGGYAQNLQPQHHTIVPAELKSGSVPMTDASTSTEDERGRPLSTRYSRK
jgi:hypothetical protein